MTNQEAKETLERLKIGIQYINKMVPADVADEADLEALDIAIKVLEDTRPTGKWGKWVISEIRCPNCLEYFETDCYSTEELKKCPNCGAQMRGGGS